MIKEKSLAWKVLLVFIFLWIIDFFQGHLLGVLRQLLIKNDARGLIEPLVLLIQFGIILPILLKVTNIKISELGINIKNFKIGFSLSMKYFLWIIILGCVVAFIQAYPSYRTFEPRQWHILRFVDEGWNQFVSILINPVLWQEIIPRGLFLVYMLKLGFNKQYSIKFFKVDQAIFITALLFSFIHLKNFIGIISLGEIIYTIIYILGAVLVGYMLGLIRKKTDSLFWPIILHTVANFGEWVVTVIVPIILVNQIPK